MDAPAGASVHSSSPALAGLLPLPSGSSDWAASIDRDSARGVPAPATGARARHPVRRETDHYEESARQLLGRSGPWVFTRPWWPRLDGWRVPTRPFSPCRQVSAVTSGGAGVRPPAGKPGRVARPALRARRPGPARPFARRHAMHDGSPAAGGHRRAAASASSAPRRRFCRGGGGRRAALSSAAGRDAVSGDSTRLRRRLGAAGHAAPAVAAGSGPGTVGNGDGSGDSTRSW